MNPVTLKKAESLGYEWVDFIKDSLKGYGLAEKPIDVGVYIFVYSFNGKNQTPERVFFSWDELEMLIPHKSKFHGREFGLYFCPVCGRQFSKMKALKFSTCPNCLSRAILLDKQRFSRDMCNKNEVTRKMTTEELMEAYFKEQEALYCS